MFAIYVIGCYASYELDIVEMIGCNENIIYIKKSTGCFFFVMSYIYKTCSHMLACLFPSFVSTLVEEKNSSK